MNTDSNYNLTNFNYIYSDTTKLQAATPEIGTIQEEGARWNEITLNLTNKHTLLCMSNVKSNGTFKHIIASLFFVKDEMTIHTEDIRDSLSYMNIDILNIFYISNDPIYEKSVHNFFYNAPRILRIQCINTDKLKEFISSDNFNEINQNALYILEDIKWSEIVLLCIESNANITISGGSTTKRHILSILDGRLISYILAILNLDFNKLNAFNNFDSVDKNYYLPYYDFSNKNQVRVTVSDGSIVIRNIKESE